MSKNRTHQKPAYKCPKCNRQMEKLNPDYEYLGVYFCGDECLNQARRDIVNPIPSKHIG